MDPKFRCSEICEVVYHDEGEKAQGLSMPLSVYESYLLQHIKGYLSDENLQSLSIQHKVAIALSKANPNKLFTKRELFTKIEEHLR